MRPRSAHRCGRRAGALLFEVLLSLALFGAAAAVALATVRSTLVAIDRSQREALAIDLARARMAELEAGLVSLATLREGADALDRVGSLETFQEWDAEEAHRWQLDIVTRPSAFTGLTVVELTVRQSETPRPVTYTLRQLVALGEDAGGEYETDELLRGLDLAEASP